MELGELSADELIALAKKEGLRLIKAIKSRDIALGNDAIKTLKIILDVSINDISFDDVWHTGSIKYPYKNFCLTGQFTTGTRAECEKKILEKGGIISKSVNLRLDYLIVGGERNDNWAHANYGRKIERALEIRRERKSGHPHIVSESDWVKSL